MKKEENLSQNLKRLEEIVKEFEEDEEIDLEKGLQRLKEAAGLIKKINRRLKEIENEFYEIKKEIEEGSQDFS